MSDTMKVPKPVAGGNSVRPLTPPASKGGRTGSMSGGVMEGCSTCLTAATKQVPKPKLNATSA